MNKATRFLVDTVKGVTLGVSVAVPGLSAGTIAVSERCYDTIIDSMTSLRKEFKKSILTLLPFVLGLLIGAVLAFIGIQKGYDVAPFTFTGLFAGLIIGSIPVAIWELKHGQNKKEIFFHIFAFSLCLIIAAGLGIVTALTNFDLSTYLNERKIWMYFFIILAGFIAAFACVVPGISGSMSMMVIGMYFPILNMVTGENSIWHSDDKKIILTGIVLLLLLVIGAIGGLIVSSKTMKILLSKHRVTTFYGILGLIIGSIVSMFINSNIYVKYQEGIATWDYIVGAILLVVGAVGSFLLIKFTNKKEAKENENIEQNN